MHPRDGSTQSLVEKHSRPIVTPERSRWTHGFLHCVDMDPAEFFEEGNGRLLAELILGVAACSWRLHAAASGTAMSRSLTSILPETKRGSSWSLAERSLC